MSGHSKWHNIKLKKGKVDAQRGALFTKLSKELILAAKGGSPDPEANYRLKMAVEKARGFNMPQENIKRAIARASGQGGEREIEEIRYEGYGPHGLAVIVDAATDNRNRTAGEMRFLFTRHEGSLGESGGVAWMFDPVGMIELDPAGKSEDALMEETLVDGVEDIEYEDDFATIYTQPAMLAEVRDALRARDERISDAFLGMRAKTKLELGGAELSAALAFLEALEEHEDAQRVFSNLDLQQGAPGGAHLKQSLSAYLPRDWLFPLVLVVFVAIVVWFGRQIFDFLIPSSATVTVPSFIGQTLSDANAEINRLRLSSAIVDHTISDRYPKGVVIMQRPNAGDQVRQGRQISFVISDGILARLMPDLRYQSLREVQLDLSRTHLALGKIAYAKSDIIPEGHVISQQPSPLTSVHEGDTVTLTVSSRRQGGAARSRFRRPDDRSGANARHERRRQTRPDRLDAAG